MWLDDLRKISGSVSAYRSTYHEKYFEVNGNMTLGENIADNGGLRTSYYVRILFLLLIFFTHLYNVC